MGQERLQVILARAGIASRRGAESMISAGRVAVNGRIVTELGSKADAESDQIVVDGKTIDGPQPKLTLMMHKPVQVVTTVEDPQGRETVADLVRSEAARFVPVGRLDYHTEGLLLMSTDGALIHRLLHPKYHVPKVYQVKVKGAVDARALDHLREGVKLDDGPTRPTVVEVLEQGVRHTWLELVVTEGRNRLVRRMVEAVGHPALRVVRTEMATLMLEDLRPGQYRYLSGSELTALYRTAQMKAPRQEVEPNVRGKARRGRGPLPSAPE